MSCKYTDEEIKNILECCGFDEDMCLDCPIQCDCEKDTEAMVDKAKAILDLINRQQAEINRLQAYHDDMESEIYSFREDHAKVKFFKGEIEAEAIKEFANMLKEEQEFFVNECDDFVGYVAVSRIDNLAKEKVEESE